MRAVTIRDGDLVVAEHPDPAPGSGEVLVSVRAAGLNGADMMQRMGRYPAPPGSPADIPGLELAGEVAARGPGADRFAVGEKVDAKITAVDRTARKLTLTIKGKEVEEEKQAMAEFGSSDSGASLGDILGAAIRRRNQLAQD